MNGHVVYGQALYDAGRYNDAESTFTTALSLDPENLIALRHLGDIARLNGNATGALEWYKRVLDADPRNEEILAFIDELQSAAAPPPPPPPAPTPPRASTPISTTAMPAPDARVSAVSTPTPIAPIESVPAPRVSEPAKRPSLSLIDVDLDLGSDAGPPPPPEPVAPSAPTGDIDLGSMTFSDSPEPAPEPFAAPAEMTADFGEPAAASEEAPASGHDAADTGLGWEMDGNIDLDAPQATPDESAPPAETPQVFVTETMAELYLQQGFRDEALQVYRQLAEMNPHDESLRERIAALESGGRSSMSFEKLGDEVPDFAPGTDGLVPINEPLPEPVSAAAPEVPVESLDFDLGMAPPAIDEPFAPAAEPEPVMELSAPAEFEIDAPVAAVEPTAAPVPEAVEVPVVDALAPVAEAPAPVADADVAGPPVSPHAPQIPAAPGPSSARSYFASLASRRARRPDGTLPTGMPAVTAEPAAPVVTPSGGSIDSLFGDAPSAADDAIGQALATAVGAVDSAAAIRGRPTQQANSEFSLDSVFRSEVAMRTSGPIQRQSQMLKFDQFFAADAAAPSAATEGEPAAPVDPNTAAPADDAQFQAWLQNLKGQ